MRRVPRAPPEGHRRRYGPRAGLPRDREVPALFRPSAPQLLRSSCRVDWSCVPGARHDGPHKSYHLGSGHQRWFICIGFLALPTLRRGFRTDGI